MIRCGVVSITNQIDANITRTAFSSYVYEYKDFAVGLVDVNGQLVAQSTGGMPPFVADAVGNAVRDGLEIYGRARLFDGDVVVCNQGEASSRARIREIPDGSYESEAFLDDDSIGSEPVPIRVKVIVEGEEMAIDFSGLADQVPGPLNSGYFGGGVTAARVAFKYLIAPREPANEGVFRPLKLILPEGKILSARPDAPMSNYSTPFPTVIDSVINCLSDALPHLATGAHFGTHSGFMMHGHWADGRRFHGHDSGHGGWAAGDGHDGAGPFRTMAHGDTRLIPMELQESLLPFRVSSLSLREDSGGPGKFRGGLGARRRIDPARPRPQLHHAGRRFARLWGSCGGRSGGERVAACNATLPLAQWWCCCTLHTQLGACP